jgi:hypothetical protein
MGIEFEWTAGSEREIERIIDGVPVPMSEVKKENTYDPGGILVLRVAVDGLGAIVASYGILMVSLNYLGTGIPIGLIGTALIVVTEGVYSMQKELHKTHNE